MVFAILSTMTVWEGDIHSAFYSASSTQFWLSKWAGRKLCLNLTSFSTVWRAEEKLKQTHGCQVLLQSHGVSQTEMIPSGVREINESERNLSFVQILGPSQTDQIILLQHVIRQQGLALTNRFMQLTIQTKRLLRTKSLLCWSVLSHVHMGSSSQRTAIMASIQTYNLLSNRTILTKLDSNAIGTPISNSGTYHTEVNTLLAGSMMITLSLLIVGLCLFLHRKFKSSTGTVSLHNLPWTDENLEVYTLSGQEEITGIYLPPTPSPPPAYETVVKIHKKDDEKKSTAAYSPINKKKIIPDDDDLPSYETAVKLREEGYI